MTIPSSAMIAAAATPSSADSARKMPNSPEQRAAFLKKLRATNPIAMLIRQGHTPDEIHKLVLRTLRPHFSNQTYLEHYALSILVPHAINVLRIQKRPTAFGVFQRCIAIYRKAHRTDAKATRQASTEFWPDTMYGVSELWSTSNLERPASDFPIHEFKAEVFRLIGALIEASMQPFLRALVAQVRIFQKKSWDATKIRDLSLGNLVDELSTTARIPDLVVPPPWGVKLSQWRNIAQHHLARIEGEKIVLSAEAAKTQAEVRLSRADALAVCRELVALFTAVKSATDIVVADLTQAAPCLDVEHGVCEEAVLLHFSSAISTQGFELLDLVIDDVGVRADFGDLMSEAPVRRVAHASQLLMLLFGMVPRPNVEIRYFDHTGQLCASMTARGPDFEAASRGLLTKQQLAARTVVRFFNEDTLRG